MLAAIEWQGLEFILHQVVAKVDAIGHLVERHGGSRLCSARDSNLYECNVRSIELFAHNLYLLGGILPIQSVSRAISSVG